MQQLKNSNLNKLQSVLRRFYHMTPLGLYSSSGILSWRRSRTLRISALVSSFALVLLISAILVPLYNKTDITEAATGTAKESSLSFNLTNSTASVDLSVNNSNGTFSTSTTPVSFNIYTTNYTGYTLSIKGSNNNQTLVNSANSGYTLATVSSATTLANFSADDTTSATNYNDTWGYLPSKLNSSTNTSYLPAPTTSATTLDKTSLANTSGTVNNYTIGIGARASYTTPAGEYTGTYILTAVGNPINYTVTYNKNTTDTVSSLPVNVSSSTSQTYITLSNNTPSREGYTFLGWCLGTITTTSNVDSCTGTTYQPGNSFYIDQESANLPTLLAMWKKDKVYMQDISLNDCKVNVGTNGNSANIGDNITVYDKRDDKNYTIRYVNGECWMTQNLRFTETTLDSATSNIASTYTAASPLTMTYYDFSVEGGSGGKCYGLNSLANSCMTDSGDTSTGAWYNYTAASATSVIDSDEAINNTMDAMWDICPKNWRLPTGTGGVDILKLLGSGQYTDQVATVSATAFGAVASGIYSTSTSVAVTDTSYYWTASPRDYGTRSTLLYNSNNEHYNGYASNYRYDGLSIRCVMSQTKISEITYLQDMNSTIANSLPVDNTFTLKDQRDEQEYTIAKLADGRVWMTKNLNLAGGTKIYATGSQIALGTEDSPFYTLPESSTEGFSDGMVGYVYNSGSTSCGNNSPCYSYYSWPAALGSYITRNNNDAYWSICPSGWGLPSSRQKHPYTNYAFYNFAAAYGLPTGSGYSTTTNSTFYNNVNGGNTDGKLPVNLVLNGNYYRGAFNDGGQYGYYWSSRAASGDTYAFALRFGATSVDTANAINRSYGLAIRCIFGE